MLLGAVFLVMRYVSSYEDTDDAQIDGHLNSISARVSGHVAKLLVEDNQYVQVGTPLVQIDPKDYEVALETAKADYLDAVALAASCRGERAHNQREHGQPSLKLPGRCGKCSTRDPGRTAAVHGRQGAVDRS